MKNGKLLAAVAAGSFDFLLTVDQNIRHQQNLLTLPVAVVVLVGRTNRLKDLIPPLPVFENAMSVFVPRQLVEIRPRGFSVVS